MKLTLPKLKFKIKQKQKKYIKHISKTIFWFLTGALLALFFIIFFGFFTYEKYFDGKIFLGVSIDQYDFSGKTKEEVNNFFDNKNRQVEKSSIVFINEAQIATISAKEINFGLNKDLLAEQAYSMGRSGDFISDLSILMQAYFSGIKLPLSYSTDNDLLRFKLKPISDQIEKRPVNAVFKFENGRVATFIPSSDGKQINWDKLNYNIIENAESLYSQKTNLIQIKIPITVLKPELTTEKANSLGIKELIGEGHSLFYHSIASRIHNVNLATSQINGVLIAPNETFSFNKALGDVSAFTGYKQAYIIQNGKTVLGDGGGVCQVSTTFFRAVLDAGLPVIERHAHAYRVGYYEEDSPPGIDATIYVPTVDLKFKNDTGNHILVQTVIDLNNLSLAFYFYGTKDGRKVTMTKPVISNQSPPPQALYQDDPTLPKGEIKQTDFAAWGANVFFTRTVEKNGEIIITDKFVSNYRPWQASYLVGTKE